MSPAELVLPRGRPRHPDRSEKGDKPEEKVERIALTVGRGKTPAGRLPGTVLWLAGGLVLLTLAGGLVLSMRMLSVAKDYRAAVAAEEEAGDDYEKAIESYKAFLEKHPSGKYADLVRECIEKDLRVKIEAREYSSALETARAAKAGDDFAHANMAYTDYLRRFPKGGHATEVRQLIHGLQRDMEEKRARERDSVRTAEKKTWSPPDYADRPRAKPERADTVPMPTPEKKERPLHEKSYTVVELPDQPRFDSTTAEPVLLRYDLNAGETFTIDLDMTMDIEMTAPTGQKLRIPTVMGMAAECRVKSKDPDGNMNVDMTFTRIAMQVQGPAGTVSFDSDKSANSPQFQALTGMINAPISAQVTPLGKVLDVDLHVLASAMRKAGGMALMPQMQQSADQIMRSTFIQLAEQPVKAGDIYDAGEIVQNTQGVGTMRLGVRYKAHSVSGDKNQVLLQPLCTFHIDSSAIDLTSATAYGWIIFDRKKGNIMRSAGKLRMGMSVSQGGQTVRMSMDSDIHYNVRHPEAFVAKPSAQAREGVAIASRKLVEEKERGEQYDRAMGRATAAAAANKWGEALAAYQQAFAVNPSTQAREGAALAAQKIAEEKERGERYDRAVADADKALERGQYAAASAEIEKALSIFPRGPEALALSEKLAPTLHITAQLNGAEYKGAKIVINGTAQKETSPHSLRLEKGKSYDVKVTIPSHDGKYYTADEKTIRADPSGPQSFRAVIEERRTSAERRGWGSETKQVKVGTPEGVESREITYYTNTIGMKFVLISTGEFMMGSPDTEEQRDRDEGPQHRVRITKPFYMGAYEVKQGEYRAVMGENPADGGKPEDPVNRVNWYDAGEFCKRLSKEEALTYRLPTEAEWECTCRAGTVTPFYIGDIISKRSASDGGTRNVPNRATLDNLLANPWGMYDMHGNVWEWCQDRYEEDYYRKSPRNDPPGPAYAGVLRVLRGGSSNDRPDRRRSANRSHDDATTRDRLYGFRVVAPAHETPTAETPKEADLIAELEKKSNINVKMEDICVQTAVDMMCRQWDLSYAFVDSELTKHKVSVEVQGISKRATLRLMLGVEGDYAIIGNCVCFGSRKNVEIVSKKKPIMTAHSTPAEAELCRMLEEKRATYSMDESPFPFAIKMLSLLAEGKIVVDHNAVEDRVVSAKVKDCRLATVLRILCGPDLNYGIGSEAIYISTDENVKVMVGAK